MSETSEEPREWDVPTPDYRQHVLDIVREHLEFAETHKKECRVGITYGHRELPPGDDGFRRVEYDGSMTITIELGPMNKD